MTILGQLVRTTLREETARMFEDHLTADLVNMLIAKYAKKDAELGYLTWEYSTKLPSSTWGAYIPSKLKLFVSQQKTKGMFKEQIKTIIHEIQHWNQHVDSNAKQRAKNTERGSLGDIFAFEIAYNSATKAYGYRNNPFEVDARRFEEKHIEEAMLMISREYSGKIEGGNLDQVIEELFDEYEEKGTITRFQIGTTLREYDMNTSQNLLQVIQALKDLGLKVT